MLRRLLWETWSHVLAVVAAVAWVAAWAALIWTLFTDPDRTDAWVWGLAAVIRASDVVASVHSAPRPSLGPRLAGVSWLASVALAGLLLLNTDAAGGVLVLGCVIAAYAVVNLPDAAGLWPGPAGGELPVPADQLPFDSR